MPFYRDILLALGICSVSKRSCSNILKSGPGNAIAIVVGGAAESLSAHPGTADLTLRKRLGFIKLAIQHGYAHSFFCLVSAPDDVVELTSCQPSRLGRTMYVTSTVLVRNAFRPFLLDIPTNAERERHNDIRASTEIPIDIWLHATTLPWSRAAELYEGSL
jgi:Diacylglycerol acyltransferase